MTSWSLAIIGLANVFGSLYAGSCVARYRNKYVLAVMYALAGLADCWVSVDATHRMDLLTCFAGLALPGWPRFHLLRRLSRGSYSGHAIWRPCLD